MYIESYLLLHQLTAGAAFVGGCEIVMGSGVMVGFTVKVTLSTIPRMSPQLCIANDTDRMDPPITVHNSIHTELITPTCREGLLHQRGSSGLE